MNPITRRAFLRWAGVAGGGLLAAGAVFPALFGGFRLLDDPEAAAAAGVDRWVYSTCQFCAVGCGVWIGVRGGRVVAVRGIEDHPVNRGMLCVKGIYQYKVLDVPERARFPVVRATPSDAWRNTTWDEVLDHLAGSIRRFRETYGPDSVAIYHSSQILLEEAYLIGKLGRGVIGTRRLDSNSTLCLASAAEGYKVSFGSDGTPTSFKDLEETDCLILIGTNTAEMHPVLFYRLQRTKRARHPFVVLIDPRRTHTAELADVHLAVRPGSDADVLKALINVVIEEDLVDHAFIRGQTKGYEELRAAVRSFAPETVGPRVWVDPAQLRLVARAFGSARRAMVGWAAGVNQSSAGTGTVALINDLCLITGNIGRAGTGPFSFAGQCASLSVREAGSTSTLSGMRPWEKEEARKEIARLWNIPEGRLPSKTEKVTTKEFWEAIEAGEVKMLWIIGSNPVVSMSDAGRFRRLLGKLELLVVQDAYMDQDTAAYAHMFLPAALWGEKEGVFTNSERRVNLLRKAVEPPGEARPDWQVVCEVAHRLGYGHLFPFRSSEEIFNEWRRVSAGTHPDMSGITYNRLERLRGIQWPCRSLEDKGTPRLYEDFRFRTPDGKARLLVLDKEMLPQPVATDDYPFYLITGRALQHWQTATKTKRIPEVVTEVGPPYMEISPQDARRLGIKEWDRVRVESVRGGVTVHARLSSRMRPGCVFIPYHFSQAPVNTLTEHAIDPPAKQPGLKRVPVRLRRAEPRGEEG